MRGTKKDAHPCCEKGSTPDLPPTPAFFLLSFDRPGETRHRMLASWQAYAKLNFRLGLGYGAKARGIQSKEKE